MSTTVLVSIDGVRPDALEIAQCPNLMAFKSYGSSTFKAQSVVPSITLPAHTSIFHSVPPVRHGITTNDWHAMARPLPGLFEQIARAKLRSGAFLGWEQLRDLSRPGSLTFLYCLNTSETDLTTDRIIVDEALRHIKQHSFDFAFVYLGTVDTVGHNHGWMSPEYIAQLEYIDGLFGTLMNGLPDDAIVLVQSDHGGHDRGHGTDAIEDMTIPWMVAGPGIRTDYSIDSPVSLLDTAPTLARILGVPAHPAWEGRCIDDVFELPQT